LLESLVNNMTLPPVRFAHPVCQPVGVLFDDLHRLVRAAAVDDDVLQIRVPCSSTERMVFSRYFPWLKEGVTIVKRTGFGAEGSGRKTIGPGREAVGSGRDEAGSGLGAEGSGQTGATWMVIVISLHQWMRLKTQLPLQAIPWHCRWSGEPVPH